MAETTLKLRRFDRGVTESYGRGKEPDGSFADSQNFVPTKLGSLETIYGYSTTGGLHRLPTGFSSAAVGTSTVDMASIVAKPFTFSSESPLAYDGRVYWFEDASDNKYMALDTWFKNATTRKIRSLFVGAGLNDLTVSGTATDTVQPIIVVEIDSVGVSFDTFKWSDGSISTTGVAITGSAQPLGTSGLSITFASATGHTLNDQWHIHGFVLLDERKQFTASDTTISGTSTKTITCTGVDAKGLSTENDYYSNPPWQIVWYDDSASEYKFATVVDYGYTTAAGGTAVFTTLEDIGSTYAKWTDVAYVGAGNQDQFYLRRWFHFTNTNGFKIPTFDTIPGESFFANNIVRGCGGASSDSDMEPWAAEYIDRTFFDGANGSIELQYKGTYVDEMECRSILVYANSPSGAFYVVSSVSAETRSGFTEVFADGDNLSVGYTIEYDNGEESQLSPLVGATISGTKTHFYYNVRVPFAAWNKRAVAVNVYAKHTPAATGIQSEAYFIRQHHLLNLTAAEKSATYGWSLNHDTSQYGSWYLLDGSIDNDSNPAKISYNDWVNAGETYFSRTGRVEGVSTYRPIVSWKYTTVVGGRRFFGNYYDPNDATVYTDQVKFTPISNTGVSSYDIIPYGDLYYLMDVASGDPTVIKGLSEDNGRLVVFKDNGIFSFYIGSEPELWVKTTISLRDGLYSPLSLEKVPGMGIVFADVEALKLLRNGEILHLSSNLESTYYNLSGKSSIKVWYDKIDQSINFTTGTPADKKFYRGYLNMLYRREDGKTAIPLYPIVVGHNIEFPFSERNGDVLFANQTDAKLFEWHKTDTTFGTATGYIRPMLKTHPYAPDESSLFVLDRVIMTKSTGASGGTTHVDSIWVDETALSITGLTGLTSTYSTVVRKVPVTNNRTGRRFRFQYSSGVPTVGEYPTSTKINLDGIDFYLIPLRPANVSR